MEVASAWAAWKEAWGLGDHLLQPELPLDQSLQVEYPLDSEQLTNPNAALVQSSHEFRAHFGRFEQPGRWRGTVGVTTHAIIGVGEPTMVRLAAVTAQQKNKRKAKGYDDDSSQM